MMLLLLLLQLGQAYLSIKFLKFIQTYRMLYYEET